MKKWILTVLLLTCLASARGQDIHFSQIDIDPILNNPAYSGFFDGTGRFGLCYRNQWASVSKAFQTVAATAEVSLMRRRYYSDGLSLGVILYSDRAGTLHYGTSAANAVFSYFKALGSSNNCFLSVAAEVGIGQAGFNTADISMEDPTELLPNISTSFVTLGVGAAWFYQPNDDFYLKVGVAGRNLNQPDISYLEQEDACIYRKLMGYTRAEYRAWSDVALLPLLAVALQENYREAVVGCDAKWYLSEAGGQLTAFSGGLHYRWRDAVMVALTAEHNAFLLSLIYDANLSKLTPASKSVGSFELCLVYRLVRQRRMKHRALPCPII